MYRGPDAAPVSAVADGLRGPKLGRFCRGCGGIYPMSREHHKGKSLNGRDHVAPPCTHEGDRFDEGETWWEDAVQVLRKPEE